MVPLTAASSLPTRALEKICVFSEAVFMGGSSISYRIRPRQNMSDYASRAFAADTFVVTWSFPAVRLCASESLRSCSGGAYIRVPAAMTDASSLKEREVVSGASVEAEAGSSAEEASFMAK